jgi:hypothetical protein
LGHGHGYRYQEHRTGTELLGEPGKLHQSLAQHQFTFVALVLDGMADLVGSDRYRRQGILIMVIRTEPNRAAVRVIVVTALPCHLHLHILHPETVQQVAGQFTSGTGNARQ